MQRFAIVNVEGCALTNEDRELIQHPGVAGIILFARNYENHAQLRALTADINKTRDSLFITVDQEGGRVQRFLDGFTRLPSMQHWGELYQKNPHDAQTQLQTITHTMVSELKAVGVHMSLVPVLDVDQGISAVIGERSFGSNPQQVVALAKTVIATMHAAGMPTLGKHFPGHGGVAADSHQDLPIDQRDRQTINKCDLMPFIQLSARLDAVMPAHVIYNAFDPNPASFSPYWLNVVLRQQLQFNGVVISDDLTMQGAAAMGSYPERAQKALAAGCDLVMVCNNRDGATAVLDTLQNHQNPASKQRVATFIRKML